MTESSVILSCKVELLYKVMDSLRDLTSEVCFDFNKYGFHMQAIGSDHISLCVCLLPKAVFDTYEYRDDISIGVHVHSILKIMKCSNPSDTMEMFIHDEYIHYVFTNTLNDRMVEFDMKLLDLDQDRMEIPNQEYECTIDMNSATFQRVIKELSMISDTLNIECKSNDRIVFDTDSDIGQGSVSLKSSDTLHIDCNESVRSSYSLKHLLMFTKSCNIAPNVYIRLSSSYPLMVEYLIEDDGYMRYYIAPKVMDE